MLVSYSHFETKSPGGLIHQLELVDLAGPAELAQVLDIHQAAAEGEPGPGVVHVEALTDTGFLLVGGALSNWEVVKAISL